MERVIMNFDIGIQLTDGKIITVSCDSDDSKAVEEAVANTLKSNNLDMSQIELIDVFERI